MIETEFVDCVVQFTEELCWKRRDEDCSASSPERTSVLHSGWEGGREGGGISFHLCCFLTETG